jgi:hypothetical protein
VDVGAVGKKIFIERFKEILYRYGCNVLWRCRFRGRKLR